MCKSSKVKSTCTYREHRATIIVYAWARRVCNSVRLTMSSLGWFPSVPEALLERTRVGGGNWSVLYFYGKALFSASVKVQHDHVTSLSLSLLSREQTKVYDLVVVGGGIVGVATAREIALRHPQMSVALVEKESRLATHQTGHNSGVIHMGVYYPPGSLKAKLCVKGADMVYQYLDKKGIPYNKCGKVIVAVSDEEVQRLRALFVRALSNSVKDIRLISGDELRTIEPHCIGKMAIHSPHTGIVDWAVVTKSYAADLREAGGTIFTGFEASKFEAVKDEISPSQIIRVQATNGVSVQARHVITCCGLYSDRVAQLSGCNPEPRIVPFRGEYLVLDRSKSHLVNGNIYPVADPRLPFLGVHFTPRMDGTIWLGPNAVLSFCREGYRYSDFSWADLKEMLSFSGLRKLMVKHWRFGAGEMYRSVSKRAQLKQLQKYIPEIQLADIKSGPTGVRAQAMDGDGSLVGDFVFDQGGGDLGAKMLHVRNAPSPGATSSLAIAEMIADKAADMFKWTE